MGTFLLLTTLVLNRPLASVFGSKLQCSDSMQDVTGASMI